MSLLQELAVALTMPTSGVQGVWMRAPYGDDEPLSQLMLPLLQPRLLLTPCMSRCSCIYVPPRSAVISFPQS